MINSADIIDWDQDSINCGAQPPPATFVLHKDDLPVQHLAEKRFCRASVTWQMCEVPESVDCWLQWRGQRL